MINRLTVILCAAFFFISMSVFYSLSLSAEDKPLKLGFAKNWPLGYMENGKPKGLLTEIAEAALSSLNRPFSMQKYPIKRMYRLTETGELDICIAIAASIVNPGTVYIGTFPLVQVQVRLFSTRPQPLPPVWDLKQQDIIVIAGYTYSGVLSRLKAAGNENRFMVAPNARTSVFMLQAGRAPYALGYRRANTKLMKQLGMNQVQSNTVHTIPMFFVVSRQAENGRVLLDQLEKAAHLYIEQRKASAAGLEADR